MKKSFTKLTLFAIALFCGNLETTAQITLLQDYKNNISAPIGVFQGINFREAGFSALTSIPNTNGKEFWTISDRGVNVDCGAANTTATPIGTVGCIPTYDKMYAFPSYVPKIHRIKINGDSIQILQTITMKRPGGTGASGIINPAGLGSTNLEIASTNTVSNCINFAANTAAKDIWGIDSEGIAVDQYGNFWISEEGGPTIWKLNSNGQVIKRYTPYGNLANSQPEDIAIDTVFKYRKNNRGFECLTITPNGKVYAVVQSPLLYPNVTVGEATQIHRMIEIDPVTNITRVFAYLNDGIIGPSGSNQIRLKDWKFGDMAAINNNEFLVIEAAARGTSDIKKIYKINISAATPITSALTGTYSVEAMVTASTLATNSIVPVTKTLFMDLLANGWPAAYDKAEGLAIINDSTIAVGNDNDFGSTCPLNNGIALTTTVISHVVTYRLQGPNKITNFTPLVVVTDLKNNSLLNINSMNIYPNPVSNSTNLTVNLNKEALLSIQVTDITGKVIISELEKSFDKGENTTNINTSNFENGIYFIKVTEGSSSITKKLVVVH